jgi:xanthine dehydrogenase YagT iron-sulfur-binding subunit
VQRCSADRPPGDGSGAVGRGLVHPGSFETMPENEPKPKASPTGHSRRDFLRGGGLAAASAVLTGPAVAALDEAKAADEATKVLSGDVPLTLSVNGKDMDCKVEPRSTLLDTLRNRLDVTGPKRVCDRASCGACTVILDGDTVYSCTTLAVSCRGKKIETLESFDTSEKGVPHAFVQNDALMCGYCTPGFVTAAKALLDKNPNPTREEVRRALDGNICRCGTYIGVFEAALAAAKAMRKEA